MSFRDDNFARRTKAEVEAQDRLRAAQERARLEAEQNQNERTRLQKILQDEELDKAIEDIQPGFFSRAGSALSSPFQAMANLSLQAKLIAGAVTVLVIVGVVLYRHEVYGLREGYVLEKGHHDAYNTVSCTTSNHITTCSTIYHPATWTITVSYMGENETWDVSEEEWITAVRNEWWCARDLGYRCRGPQDHYVDPAFYSLHSN